MDLDATVSQTLEAGKVATYSRGSQSYGVDPTTKQQTNTGTNVQRKVRRKPGQVSSVGIWQVYLADHKRWADLTPTVSQQLDAVGTASYTRAGQTYDCDATALQQTNRKTNVQRQLQRTQGQGRQGFKDLAQQPTQMSPNPAPKVPKSTALKGKFAPSTWRWMDAKTGKYEFYSPAVDKQLEQAFLTAKPNMNFQSANGVSYFVNIKNKTQLNVSSGNMCKIMRFGGGGGGGAAEEYILKIALEPEAASLSCRTRKLGSNQVSLRPGQTCLVADMRGGTVDITVHKIVQAKKEQNAAESTDKLADDAGSAASSVPGNRVHHYCGGESATRATKKAHGCYDVVTLRLSNIKGD